ncbi:hypothetical protein [Pseudomonas sp. NPDC089734]|uniref:hypothetical protein n=1 Tax=Pseudomonas sp. NPDC089734 TaxID=3364469 RepID=UPI0038005F41
MKRTLVFILACISSSAESASPVTSITKPLSKHMHTLSNAFACTIMADTAGINKAPQCRDNNKPAPTDTREFDKAADKKTLRECMKPYNLIDDDVRKCMKGF